jgi:hypothetical protein
VFAFGPGANRLHEVGNGGIRRIAADDRCVEGMAVLQCCLELLEPALSRIHTLSLHLPALEVLLDQVAPAAVGVDDQHAASWCGEG